MTNSLITFRQNHSSHWRQITSLVSSVIIDRSLKNASSDPPFATPSHVITQPWNISKGFINISLMLSHMLQQANQKRWHFGGRSWNISSKQLQKSLYLWLKTVQSSRSSIKGWHLRRGSFLHHRWLASHCPPECYPKALLSQQTTSYCQQPPPTLLRQMVIHQCLQLNILDKLHSGHFGVSKYKGRVQNSVWWPNIMSQIETCHKCKQYTLYRPEPTEPFLPLLSPENVWECIVTSSPKHSQRCNAESSTDCQEHSIKEYRSLSCITII